MDFQKYGTNPELDKLVVSEHSEDRITAVEQGYGLDILINDKNSYIRQAVARQGYGLDRLINDKVWWVRQAVAEQGYGLDILITDEDDDVRAVVARQGYGLDILVNDISWFVRQACFDSDAWKEFCANNWETLIINDYERVRMVIANQGYGLNILIHDDAWLVREAVKDYLKDHNLTLEQWEQQNGIESDNNIIQDFIYRIDDSSKLAAQGDYDSIDEFLNESISNNVSSNVLTIIAVDTKIPLITLEKINVDNKTVFKFIVDITNDNDYFRVKTTIKSKNHLNQLIEQTIEALTDYSEYSKYLDELENCLL